MYMHGFGFGGWLFPALGILCFGALAVGTIILIIWAVRQVSRDRHPSSGHQDVQTPEDILKARYARGEITKKEYKEILADIKD